jgi:CRISPR-associated protein Csh2
MTQTIKNRSELLFLYEIENANPNGDPLNENRPRYDAEDSTVIVSDVRLKRTIRDYWFEYKGFNGNNGKDIFVRETLGDRGNLNDAKERVKSFDTDSKKILSICIDARAFGMVGPLEKKTTAKSGETGSITYTGPVQFQMGRSLHKTEIKEEEGTSQFASTTAATGSKDKGQGTFRTEYKIPYALIGFNGVINEKSAKYSLMSDDDKKLLEEGIWEGTKNLISRSKFGQNPVLLLVINYKDSFYIGNLRQRLKLKSDKNDLAIRGLADFELDLTEVIVELKANKSKIDSVEIKLDSRLKLFPKVTITDGKLDLNAL